MEYKTQNWEEQGLRAAILRGDESAWRVLYERYFDALYTYVYFRCGQQTHRTEEVVQDSWMTTVRRIRSFDPDCGAFESWLRGIANNVLRNHRRRWLRRDQTEIEALDRKQTANATVKTTHRAELEEQIALAYTALSVRYQGALRAKYEEERSVADIAARWGESLKAVESLLSRARAAFREAYRQLEKES